MTIINLDTSYKKNKDGKLFSRRFYECKKCHNRFYSKEPHF